MSEHGQVEEDLFDIVLYLVNSAPTSLGETPSLAAFRMVDAADRLLAVLQRTATGPEQQSFLAEARADYDDHYNLVMTDQDAFMQWLPDFVRRCTEEGMHRAAVRSPSADPANPVRPQANLSRKAVE